MVVNNLIFNTCKKHISNYCTLIYNYFLEIKGQPMATYFGKKGISLYLY